jgi:hypothetical protein
MYWHHQVLVAPTMTNAHTVREIRTNSAKRGVAVDGKGHQTGAWRAANRATVRSVLLGNSSALKFVSQTLQQPMKQLPRATQMIPALNALPGGIWALTNAIERRLKHKQQQQPN